jgi:hypothetical protein
MLSYLNNENREYFSRMEEYNEKDFYPSILDQLMRDGEYDWQDELDFLESNGEPDDFRM